MMTAREFYERYSSRDWYFKKFIECLPNDELVVLNGLEVKDGKHKGLIPTNPEYNGIPGWDAYLFFTPEGKQRWDDLNKKYRQLKGWEK